MANLITRAIINYGMGDALNARTFLINYCKQKKIATNTIHIYSPKYWWMFEGLGFIQEFSKRTFLGLVPYKNFGKYNLPRIVNEKKLDKCIAVNAGIEFSFDYIEFLPRYTEPKINLPDKFITFNTGYGMLSGKPLDKGYICTKAWPEEYWQKFVDLIDFPCVQIGAGPSCTIMRNTKLNLVDQLNIKQSAEVMRKALFHVDIEGGLPILNQHLGGKSVVLFGPTAIEQQGRSFNLNLRANTCTPCYEWGTDDKSLSMLRHQLPCNAHCMKDLKPEYVVEQIYKNKWL